MAKIAKNLTELIGHTPLMELAEYSRKYGLKRNIVAKLESFNPAGSVKDRVAFAMLDNAIRFDGAVMLKNEGYEDAWSMDQESVDLNAYLALECKLLKKFSSLLKIPFDAPDYSSQVADYFFDKNINFFCDRRLKDGSFI